MLYTGEHSLGTYPSKRHDERQLGLLECIGHVRARAHSHRVNGIHEDVLFEAGVFGERVRRDVADHRAVLVQLEAHRASIELDVEMALCEIKSAHNPLGHLQQL